jgi:hypothetical protein
MLVKDHFFNDKINMDSTIAESKNDRLFGWELTCTGSLFVYICITVGDQITKTFMIRISLTSFTPHVFTFINQDANKSTLLDNIS